MVSGGGERLRSPVLPDVWMQLEREVEEAATALRGWRRRALEAEEEVSKLRHALEELASGREQGAGASEEVRRLRAENAALRSRMAQARKRVTSLLGRLAALEGGR